MDWASFPIKLAGFFVLLATVTAVEFLAPVERYSLTSRVRGLAFGLINLFGGLLVFAALTHGWRTVGVPPIVTVPVASLFGDAAAIILALLFFDLVNYWNHRFQHRFLWPVHAVHHTQTELNAANGYAHFTERAFRFLLFMVPLSLIQLHFPPTPFVLLATCNLLECYIHSSTSIGMGPLRRVLVDNRFHRIHHSLEPKHFDKNFGLLFSFWDRLFGTAYEPQPDQWPATGLAGHAPPQSISQYLLFPVRFSTGVGRANLEDECDQVGSAAN